MRLTNTGFVANAVFDLVECASFLAFRQFENAVGEGRLSEG